MINSPLVGAHCMQGRLMHVSAFNGLLYTILYDKNSIFIYLVSLSLRILVFLYDEQ